MNNKNGVKNYFDLYGSKLKNIYRNTFEPVYESVISIVEEFEKKESTVLEIGCGMGELLFNLKIKFPHLRIIGVDFSDKMIELARKKCETMIELGNEGIVIINEDILTFKINKNFFNFIISVNTLHHLKDKDKRKVFKNIFDGLVKNGLFIYNDITKITSNEINNLQQKLLLKKINEDKMLSDLERKIRINHHKLDRPMDDKKISLVLEEVGFKDLGILYKNLSNTLMVAIKG